MGKAFAANFTLYLQNVLNVADFWIVYATFMDEIA